MEFRFTLEQAAFKAAEYVRRARERAFLVFTPASDSYYVASATLEFVPSYHRVVATVYPSGNVHFGEETL